MSDSGKRPGAVAFSRTDLTAILDDTTRQLQRVSIPWFVQQRI
jgi:hypothetical protein